MPACRRRSSSSPTPTSPASACRAIPRRRCSGTAGPPDPVEGYKWLLLAEKGGHPDSRVVREKAAEQIAEPDRKRAEALAQRFVPTSERPSDDGAAARANPPRTPSNR